MLPSTLWIAVSFLAAAVSAQSSYTPPAGFDPSAVEASVKASWCDAQSSTCPKLCDGFAKVNRCDASKLTFECVCGDGTVPKVEDYKNTLPYFVCLANFGQCIDNHPNDLEGQRECQRQRKLCGSLEASGSGSTSTTLSSATATATQSDAEAATSAGGPAATSNAAPALHVAQDYSLGMLTCLFAGAFGFLV
ncbi:uncharacterized protein CIMG_07502 [Coccidioides immitis RS]|uniref:DUF7707 domain-containing protein n=3 Tax=Coccidioides immitis TaxID=5501 RepID=J3K3I9_COCIM|nr:uncharacterized protein CIMG_07502 [Coccidioides immitis RS]EAS28756.3 hypothetical protein CIMG_07502 [Coccidioides immitis RS]KMU80708.1 hypothetical protein CISG_08772 [Coccidioides immitis RMSCC 3703]KMU91433.1 hypothetical protein CIHG_09302 [Coccidioides immitis H538.4]TPX23064.1 hypothetical protein DIZ76_014946 [Coccidioides immitis]